MRVVMTVARLKERGEAIWAWERAGGRTGRLVWLDAQVRDGHRTDWPGRPRGVEPRTNDDGRPAAAGGGA